MQFSHFLEFLNVDIDMYYLHQSAYYLYKANDSASILASLKHSATVSMKKLCDPAITVSCPPPAVVTQATIMRPGPGHKRNVIFLHSWHPGTGTSCVLAFVSVSEVSVSAIS